MNNIRGFLFKTLSAAMCFCMALCAVACSSDSGKAQDGTSNNEAVNFNGLPMEFKYSKNYSDWAEVTSDSELFRADGKYSAGDVEVVYLNIKNHAESSVNYKITLKAESGSAGGAMFGYVSNVRSAYSDVNNAVADVASNAKAVGSDYVLSKLMNADSAVTLALVVYVPAGAQAADMKLSVSFSAISADTSLTDNSAVTENGKMSVYANSCIIVEDSTDETVITNSDKSFKAVFKAGSVAQGSLLSAVVRPSATADSYDIALYCDGVAYTGEAVTVSLLVGYGFNGVEIYAGETKLEADYNMYGGVTDFSITSGGTYTVKTTGSVDITGILVQGADKPFGDFNSAIDYIVNSDTANIGDTVNFIILGKIKYRVAEGEKVSFVGNHSQIKTINVIGGNAQAELVIDVSSGSLPSLPYASKGIQINYFNLMFDSEKTSDAMHFDYRADADISFRNCTFKRALATRGPSSNVVVDHCVFSCKTVSDTLKGYCYYSVSVIGANTIRVEFTNNTVTDSWGGINLDWAPADFYVAGNTFANINCSKAAIQLSRATTVLVENNKFSNIKNENVIRFYSAYGASSTHIINNEIDADYLFYSDNPNVISSFKDFRFEDNVISSTTNLTIGHVANASADQVREHGYVVDTSVNTIK